MKILIFSTAYLPWIGGAEIAVKEITERLANVQFDLITTNLSGLEPAIEKIGNSTVYRVGKGRIGKFLLPFWGFLKARSLQEKEHYDLVWSIMASQASVAASFFKMFFPNMPLVLTLQEGDEEDHLKRYVGGSGLLYALFIRPWHRLVFKKATVITAISQYLKNRALRVGVTAPIQIIPNGVDVARFSKKYSDTELAVIKNSIGKTPDEKIIITTSRLVTKNAVDDLILSLQFLPNNVKLVILGTGPEQGRLEELAHEKKLDHSVIFLGHIPHDDIPKYLAVADVFVRAPISEGMGNSFIEAMAAWLPVVATPVGGIVDFLRDGETGLFCEVHNPKSIAGAVQKYFSNDALRQKIVSNAASMVGEAYAWDTIACDMEKVFTMIV